MRNPNLVDWWLKLCVSRYFDRYQYKEQDFMNIIFWYGNYRSKCFDWSDNWHGLVSKGYWPYIKLNDKKELVLPKGKERPQDGNKTIKVIHYAGGNRLDKMNFGVHFKPEVVKRIKELIK